MGTVDFDPGEGVFEMTAMLLHEIFITKMDGNGNLIWAKSLPAGDVSSIAVNARGNVYVSGVFYETTDFDPGPGITNLIS